MKCVNLEKLLKDRKMKKQDLAKALNITPSAISAYISGRNEPDLETLFRICDLLDTDIKVIVGRANYSRTITDDDMKLIEYHQSEINKILNRYKMNDVEKKN